jgi:hypothetical protein
MFPHVLRVGNHFVDLVHGGLAVRGNVHFVVWAWTGHHVGSAYACQLCPVDGVDVWQIFVSGS